MKTPLIFRAGRHLILGEKIHEEGDNVNILIRCRLERKDYFPLEPESVLVNRRFVVREDRTTHPLKESSRLPYAALIHESVMPLVVSMRRLKLPSSDLVAYEARQRGLGFLTEGSLAWSPMSDALTNVELGERIALEALKPVLESMGLHDRTRPEGITEQLHVLERTLPVYMKREPYFHDISEVHAGTTVTVLGYDRGCALIEADSEDFWIPLEESSILPNSKDDHFFRTLDADRDYIDDPLNYLPSKAGHGAVVGSAAREDNWNAQAEEHRIAGNYYGNVDWIPNPSYRPGTWILKQEVPGSSVEGYLDRLAQGVDPDKIVSEMVASSNK